MLCIRGTSLCLSVSVCHKSEFCSEHVWTCQPSYTVLKGNLVFSKNKGTSLWNVVLNSGLRKFCHGISIVETCYQLSSRKVDVQSVINWAVVGQLSRKMYYCIVDSGIHPLKAASVLNKISFSFQFQF